MTTKIQSMPTGTGWCGCQKPTKAGASFLTGHDKTLTSAVVQREYGSVVDFVVTHGYGPGGKNARAQLAVKKTKRIAAWAKGKG
jgi:hypothetical protein